METKCDFVTALLAIGEGGVDFFASCLLHLDPHELKTCRLVNRAWDEFIRKEVWGSKKRRLLLKEKLVERWRTSDLAAEEFSHVTMVLNPYLDPIEVGTVDSIFCNDSHIVCGLESGKVGVYCLTTGEWVRDLMPGKVDKDHYNVTRVAGSDLVVAAAMWSTIVTVWSGKKEMDQLFCLDVLNYPCMGVNCGHDEDWDNHEVEEIQVVGNKVVFLREDTWRGKFSLIVIDKGEQNVWESKTLACLDDHYSASLATEKDWIAVARTVSPWSRSSPMPSNTDIKLWENDTFRQDISLPDCRPVSYFTKIALKLPFIVVSSEKISRVKVFQLASDNMMEDPRPVASPIKTIQLEGEATQMIFNELLFGFVLAPGEDGRQDVVLIEKKALLDASVPSEETEKRQILLHEDGSTYTVGMNTTSLVFALWLKKDEDDEQGSLDDYDDSGDSNDYDEDFEEEEVVVPLHKMDFWRTSNVE